MPVKSKKRAAKREPLDRPFDPAILRRRQGTRLQYRIVLEPNNECGYLGSSLEMPNVYADMRATVEECVKNVREAIAGAVAYLIETGKRPHCRRKSKCETNKLTSESPPPSSKGCARGCRQWILGHIGIHPQ